MSALEPAPPAVERKLVALAIATLAFVAIPLVLGKLAPETHEARTSVDLVSPPDVVYRRIAEIGRWPTWYPYVGAMTPEGPRRFSTHPDRKSRLDYVLRQADGRSHVVIELEARPRRLGAVWTFDIEPHGTGSHVRIHERGFTTSPTARFAMRYLVGYDVAILGFAKALERAERDAPPAQADAGR